MAGSLEGVKVVDTALMGSVIAALAFVLAPACILGREFPREIRAQAIARPWKSWRKYGGLNERPRKV